MNTIYRFKVNIRHKTEASRHLSWHMYDHSMFHVKQKLSLALNNIQKRNVLAQNYEIGEVTYEPEEQTVA
jgi:hypothetical protein